MNERQLSSFLTDIVNVSHQIVLPILQTAYNYCKSSHYRQWRNDGVAAASSDGGPTGGRVGGARVLEFLVISFSVSLVLLSNCYIIIYCIV